MKPKTLSFLLFLTLWLVSAIPVAHSAAAVPAGFAPAEWAHIQSQLSPQAITAWNEQAKLTASAPAADDSFGYAVAVSGDTAVIGAYLDDDSGFNSGSAYVFTRSGGVWSQQAQLTASDSAAGDSFGWSVAISGDTAVIGAYSNDTAGSNSGSAYVFTRSGGVWSQQAKLTASDPAANDFFGYAVAVDGDTAVIGAVWDDEGSVDSGSAYIFTHSGGVWSQQAKLTASDPATNDFFGFAVAVDGDTAVIGVLQDDDDGVSSGSAYVFSRSGEVWSQVLQDDDDGVSSGSAYVFSRSGEVWSQQTKLTATDAAGGDVFGNAVAVNGDTAVIGAYRDDDGGVDSGSAYIFTRSGTTWSQQAKLTASDAAAGDYFGRSVAVSGDTAVIGAYWDDDGGNESGSAYVFSRNGGVWSQQAKLTASDPAANDFFGYAVAVSGDTAVIGAHLDDDGSSGSGSAYVFTLQHTLNLNTTGTGAGSVTANPAGPDYDYGTVVTLTATANTGSTFTGWSGDLSGTTNPITLTMDSDKTITATFELNQYTLDLSTTGTGAGSVTANPAGPDYDYGTVVTLTATANTGSTFTGWSGDLSGTTNPITLTMDGDKTVTATFTLNQHTLDLNTTGTGAGSVTANPAGPLYEFGTVVTLTATADITSTFTGWSGDVVTTTNPITLTMDGDKTITATFTAEVESSYMIYLPLINTPQTSSFWGQWRLVGRRP